MITSTLGGWDRFGKERGVTRRRLHRRKSLNQQNTAVMTQVERDKCHYGGIRLYRYRTTGATIRRMKKTATSEEAIASLQAGGVGVLPTDTVYGLVARAADKAAVARLYALKRRERKPGTVVAASVEQLVELGLGEQELRLVEHLWPDSISLIISAGKQLSYLHMGLDSLAVRVPKDTRLREVLEQTGPLVTTSANPPGERGAVRVDEAWRYFGDEVDFYVDGGDLSGRQPSTIVRISEGQVEILRDGAVKLG
jgi:L-threonylcarbamoyladenylate synthase